MAASDAGKTRAGVLISGGGSNMTALARAALAPDCPYVVTVVIANSPDAPGLARAAGMGLEALCIDHRPHKADRQAHEHLIDAALRARGVQVVALAGYMRVLTPFLVEAWAGRMLNIHPSLLPAFPGLHTHRRALEAGAAEHGCTVHLVTQGVDEGPILGQARVPVLADDDETRLAARVLEQEHRLYPACLSTFVRTLGS